MTYCSLVALALCLNATGSQAAGVQSIASVYTDYDANKCAHKPGRAVEDYGEWRCRGLDGMAMLVSAGDQRMTMSFGPRAADEPPRGRPCKGSTTSTRRASNGA